MNKAATEKLKSLCVQQIKEELNINPKISNHIISFKLPELNSKSIETLNDLGCMCKEIKVKTYKMSALSIKLLFEL